MDSGTLVYPVIIEPSFGNDELGRITRTCYEHRAQSIMTTTPPPRIPRFLAGWEACEKVWATWLDSEEARRQREAAAEDERQRQRVIEFVKGLK